MTVSRRGESEPKGSLLLSRSPSLHPSADRFLSRLAVALSYTEKVNQWWPTGGFSREKRRDGNSHDGNGLSGRDADRLLLFLFFS